MPTRVLAEAFLTLMQDAIAKEVTAEALASLRTLFATPTGAGSQMAARAAGPLADPDSIAASSAALTVDLLEAVVR